MKNCAGIGSLLILLTATAACGPGARMVPPPELVEETRVLEVADRSSATGLLANESFKLGSYEVTDVDRDWNSNSSMGAGPYGSDKKTTGYSYKLKTSAGTWEGICASLQEGKNVGGLSFANGQEITCECKEGKKTSSFKLAGEHEASSGSLSAGGKTYQVKSVEDTDKSHYGAGPAGYRADEDDAPVAAVEVLRPGRIWLAKNISDEDAAAMSCSFAGIMLYVPPSDH